MRDLVLLIIIGGGSLYALRQPWVGAIVWTWVSLMSPHVQWGYAAAGWPVATGVALTTMTGLFFTKDKQSPFVGGVPVGMLLAFVAWVSITLPPSFYPDDSYPLWVRSMKIYLMLFVTLALITDRRKLDWFIWINVISIGFYGLKGGVFTILSGGSFMVWGPGGFIEGNNEIALAVIAVIPLMRYLQLQMTHKRARQAMGLVMGLSVVMALGTYSRGALVGLIAMGTYFWVKSDKKVQWGLAIAVVGAAALSVMPDQWWARMDTINTYQTDSSAMGRINAWWMAFNLAKDNFFGGGFSVWTAQLFERYAPNPADVHAAHSIYFQVLGEHGFIGLALFLLIGISTWVAAAMLIRAARFDPANKWAADLGAMVQVSMIGYGAAGAFLSLAYFDLPYNVMAMVVLARYFLQKRATTGQIQPAMR